MRQKALGYSWIEPTDPIDTRRHLSIQFDSKDIMIGKRFIDHNSPELFLLDVQLPTACANYSVGLQTPSCLCVPAAPLTVQPLRSIQNRCRDQLRATNVVDSRAILPTSGQRLRALRRTMTGLHLIAFIGCSSMQQPVLMIRSSRLLERKERGAAPSSRSMRNGSVVSRIPVAWKIALPTATPVPTTPTSRGP